VGDVIRIGSLTMASLNIEAPIQPDGTIMLPQVGPVVAAGKNLESLRIELDQKYRTFLKEPGITVIPVAVNRTVQELIASINNRSGIFAGQAFNCRVSPDGTVQLPAIGSVPVQGFTLAELRNEIESRYAELVQGIDITPVLRDRAPRSLYVLGEVQKPGNYTLNNPTTVIQAIAQAGGWNIGGNLRQVIVFRRDAEWRLMATRVNVRPALYNSRDLDAQDIWLRDNDIVIVPKCPLQVLDDYINLFFTKGVYGVVPFSTSFSIFKDLSTVGGVPI
jgi:polysaccharide export outer membrane protein